MIRGEDDEGELTVREVLLIPDILVATSSRSNPPLQ